MDIVNLGLKITGIDSVRDLTNHLNKLQSQSDKSARSANELSNTTAKLATIATTLNKTFEARGVHKMADAMKGLVGRIQEVTGSTEATERVLLSLQNTAGRSTTNFIKVANAFQRIHVVMKETGSSADSTSKLLESFIHTLSLSGSTTTASTSALVALTKAMQEGSLSTAGFNNLLKNNPSFVKQMAGALGMTIRELREFAKAGGISSEILERIGNEALPSVTQAAERAGVALRGVGNDGQYSSRGIGAIHDKLVGLGNYLKGAVWITTIATMTKAINDLFSGMDVIVDLEGRLDSISDSGEEAAVVFDKLKGVAARSTADLTATVEAYQRIHTAIKSVGGEAQVSVDIVEAFNHALDLSGSSGERSASALNAFTNAMLKGSLRGTDFNNVLINNSRFAEGLAKAFDTDIVGLKALADQGKITSDDLVRTAQEGLGSWAEESMKAAKTSVDRVEQISNSFKDLSGAIHKFTGGDGLWASFQEWLADALSWGARFLTTLSDEMGKLDGHTNDLKNTAKGIGDAFISGFQKFMNSPVISAITGFFDWVGERIVDWNILFIGDAVKAWKPYVQAANTATAAAYAALEARSKLGERTKEWGDKFAAAGGDNPPEPTGKSRRSKTISEIDQLRKKLAEEMQRLSMNAKQWEIYQAKLKGANSADIALIKGKQALKDALDKEADFVSKANKIREELKTNTEKYLEQEELLVELLDRGLLTWEQYTQKLIDVGEEYGFVADKSEQLVEATKKTDNQLNQFALQAARNIQTAFADYLFNPFDKGLKGMLSGFIDVIKRMAAEVLSSRIFQGFTIGFGGASAAHASGGGGNTGIMDSITGAFNSMGGAGANLVGQGISAVGDLFGLESVSSFGSGFSGASGAVAGDAFMPGALGAQGTGSMGASLGSMASTAMASIGAGMVGAGIGSALAGDKKIFGLGGGTTSGAGAAIGAVVGGPIGAIAGGVIGGAINALFGRGPYKYQDTTMALAVDGDDFRGETVRRDKSKGGLFAKNKNKYDIQGLDWEVWDAGNRVVEAFKESIRLAGDNFILDSSFLENYYAEFQIVSEKGKELTEEAINDLFKDVGSAMVDEFSQIFDQMSRRGESSIETLERLNAEFGALTLAAQLSGLSLKEAQDAIRGLGLDHMTELVEQMGGAEEYLSLLAGFMDGFFTEAELFKIQSDSLNAQLEKIGLSTDITAQEFKDLVLSFGHVDGISVELYRDMLRLAPQFASMRTGVEELTEAASEFVYTTELIASLRGQLNTLYQKEMSTFTALSDSFRTIAQNLRAASDSLSLGSLSPLTPKQKLDEARKQFDRDKTLALSGDEDAMGRLAESGRALLEASQVYNASSQEYVDDFKMVKSVLDRAADIADRQVKKADDQSDLLTKEVSLHLETNQRISTSNELLAAIHEAILLGPGNDNISGQQILADLAQMTNDQQVAKYMMKNEISAKQLSDATGVSEREIIDRFIDSGFDHKLTPENQQHIKNTAESMFGGVVRSGSEHDPFRDMQPKISDQDIRDFTYGKSEAELAAAAKEHNIDQGRIADLTGVYLPTLSAPKEADPTITDQMIRDFVGPIQNNDRLIYETAIQHGISSQRLAKALGIPVRDIHDIVKRNGWAMFEQGTDYVPRTGMAMLHKGEAVTPANDVRRQTESMKNLNKEVASLKQTTQALLTMLIDTVRTSSSDNAETIVDGVLFGSNSRPSLV